MAWRRRHWATRGNELKLEEKDLHEDPGFIVNALKSYVRAKTFDIEALEARVHAVEHRLLVDTVLHLCTRRTARPDPREINA